MKVISCSSNLPLAQQIVKHLNIDLTQTLFKRFKDMEIFVEIMESVRGENVFVIQSTSYPANDNLMELLITIDAARRASARKIIAVIPYFGYARQDRKANLRTPISAKLVANMITAAGANQVLTLDLHTDQIQGFFDIPVDNLYAAPVIIKDIKEKYTDRKLSIVSPDIGGVIRARYIAKKIGSELIVIDKRRDNPGNIETLNIIGEVKGKDCIIIDDIVDSAGTICKATNALKDK
ncbi:MAG: ribose-phosphate diphosphokinase, partial [Alphaproteobacteria bacterium]